MSVTDQEYAEYQNWAKEQKVEKYRRWKAEQEVKKGAGKIVIGSVVFLFIVLPLIGWLCSLGNNDKNSNNTATYYTGTYMFGYTSDGESVLYKITLNPIKDGKIGTFIKESVYNGEKNTDFSYPFTYDVTTNQLNELEFKADFQDKNSLKVITGTFLGDYELQIKTNFYDKVSNPIFRRGYEAALVTEYCGMYTGGWNGGVQYSVRLDYDNSSNTGVLQKSYYTVENENSLANRKSVLDKVETYEFNYSIINREFKAIFKNNNPVESISGTVNSVDITKPIVIKITLPKEITTAYQYTMTFKQANE